MLILSHYLQIARIVVTLIPVDVMNHLVGFQRATENLFGDDTMFVLSEILSITGGSFVELSGSISRPFLGESVDRLVHSNDLFRPPFAIGLADVLRHQVSTLATTFY